MANIPVENIAILVGIVILLVLFLFFVFVIVLFFQLRKLQGNKSDPSELAPQIAVLARNCLTLNQLRKQ